MRYSVNWRCRRERRLVHRESGLRLWTARDRFTGGAAGGIWSKESQPPPGTAVRPVGPVYFR